MSGVRCLATSVGAAPLQFPSTPLDSHNNCFILLPMIHLRAARAAVSLASLFTATALVAMTVMLADFDLLLGQAEQIYKARVISVTTNWSGEGANRHPATFVRLRVLESYRGGAEGEQILEFSGGTVGSRTLRIPGMPEFRAGEVEILFVRGNHTAFCPLVGIFHGRLRVVQSAANGAEEILLHDGTPLFDTSQIGKSSEGLKPDLAAAARLSAAKGPNARALTSAELGAAIRVGLMRKGITPDQP